MIILGIETSCDDTALALIETREVGGVFECLILSSLVHSQAELHSPYGGVFPTLAKREHEKNLPVLLEKLLEESMETQDSGSKTCPWLRTGIQEDNKNDKIPIDVIAVTEGPGLEPALWTGITFAQKLAADWQKPLFGVNHLEGHLISSLASPVRSVSEGVAQPAQHSNILQNVRMFKLEKIQFPILGLLVSGGHTQFIKCTD